MGILGAMPNARVVPRLPVLIAIVLIALIGLGAFQLLRPLPAIASSVSVPASSTVPGSAPPIPWPAKGGAALSLSTTGLIASFGETAPKPMASITKVMTALVVLDDHPLKSLEQGPAITVDPAAEADFKARQANNESVVPVKAGEQLSEYQLLQGLLIPSGNNYGDILARWDAGTVDAFVAKMNARAKALRLAQTTYADTSGASSQSVSTPTDLVSLAAVAVANPVIAEITAMPQVELPVAGIRYNVNKLVGTDGIFGVKTGSSPEANANLVFASKQTVLGQPVTIFGAVMGLDLLEEVFTETTKLVDAVKTKLVIAALVQKGQKVGRYTSRWGAASDVTATADVSVVTWPTTAVTEHLRLKPLEAPFASGAAAGTLRVQVGQFQVDVATVTAGSIDKPGAGWRLTRLS